MIDSEDEIAALGRMVACGRESLMILFREPWVKWGWVLAV